MQKTVVTFFLLIFCAIQLQAQEKTGDKTLDDLWDYKRPCGITYNPYKNVYYISNLGMYDYYPGLEEKKDEDDGYIIIYDPETGRKMTHIDGEYDLGYDHLENMVLNTPIGMQMVGENSLYICDFNINQLVEYDLANDSVKKRIDVDTNVFKGLNDICYDGTDNLYMTNVKHSKIYKYQISTETLTEMVLQGDSVIHPISIYYDDINSRLLYLSYQDSSQIEAIDLSTNTVSVAYSYYFYGPSAIAKDDRGTFFILCQKTIGWLLKVDDSFTEDPVFEGTLSNKPGDIYLNNDADVMVIASQGTDVSFLELLYDPVTLVYPANSAQSVETDIELVWTTDKNAEEYKIEIATDSNFTDAVEYVNERTIDYDNYIFLEADTTLIIDSLISGQTYYWRVTASNIYTDSPESSTFTFTTSSAKQAPTLISPTANESFSRPFVDFEWSSLSDIQYYILQVSQSDDFSEIDIMLKTESTTYTYDDFAMGTDYYWRVKTTGGSNGSPWSESGTFSIDEAQLDAPTILSPFWGCPNIPNDAELQWEVSENADYYILEIGMTDVDYKSYLEKEKIIVYDTITIINDLVLSQPYLWRVRAVNDSSVSEWDKGLFIVSDTIIETPSIKPIKEDSIVSVYPKLQWTNTNAKLYYLEIAETDIIPDVPGIMLGETEEGKIVKSWYIEVRDTLYIFDEPLAPNTLYMWRVMAIIDNAWSSWSEPASFITQKEMSVFDSDEKVSVNITPNPILNSASIEVNWPVKNIGTIELYNTLGNKTAVIFEGMVQTESSIFILNTADISPGTYFLKTTVGEYNSVEKIIIIK